MRLQDVVIAQLRSISKGDGTLWLQSGVSGSGLLLRELGEQSRRCDHELLPGLLASMEALQQTSLLLTFSSENAFAISEELALVAAQKASPADADMSLIRQALLNSAGGQEIIGAATTFVSDKSDDVAMGDAKNEWQGRANDLLAAIQGAVF